MQQAPKGASLTGRQRPSGCWMIVPLKHSPTGGNPSAWAAAAVPSLPRSPKPRGSTANNVDGKAPPATLAALPTSQSYEWEGVRAARTSSVRPSAIASCFQSSGPARHLICGATGSTLANAANLAKPVCKTLVVTEVRHHFTLPHLPVI